MIGNLQWCQYMTDSTHLFTYIERKIMMLSAQSRECKHIKIYLLLARTKKINNTSNKTGSKQDMKEIARLIYYSK